MNERNPYALGQLGNAGMQGCATLTDKTPENIGSKLKELNSALGESLFLSAALASALIGPELDKDSPSCPSPSGVIFQLEDLLRSAREVNRLLTRANQAVGN